MASMLFKEMKGLNFSCTSPASTAAICATIDGSSIISSGTGRAIDRYNPHLRDPRRIKPVKPPALLLPPQLPPSSKAKKKMHKKSNNVKSSEKPNSANFVTISNNNTSASPGSSTRFLLNSDVTLSHDHVFAEPEFLSVSSFDKDHEPSPSSSSSSSSSSIVTTASSTSAATSSVTGSDTSGDHAVVVKPENQVVVLRVSLHCKGCEGKVRKHISKMEGVKSFFIDFAAKKVTVIGDVTPLGVLNSISKVKSAQFWPSPGDSSS